LCPYNLPAKEVGGLEVYLHEAAQSFELFSNTLQKIKIKKAKAIAVDVLSRPIQ
jgi:hypothetical protein